MGKLISAGVNPTLLVQKPARLEGGKRETVKKKKHEAQKEVLDKIDLTGLEEWSEFEQKEA